MAKKKEIPEKYSLVEEVYQGVLEIATVNKKGEVVLKKTDIKQVLESAFETAALAAASGQRVRLPVIGILGRAEIKARKAGKGTNPFTGEPIDIKARPASKKPRWTFPKTMKEIFANKKNW
jgi:nucleoid DNA-binding protein